MAVPFPEPSIIVKNLLLAGTSASFAAMWTSPLDITRFRLQIYGHGKAASPKLPLTAYKSVPLHANNYSSSIVEKLSTWDVVTRTFRREGIPGFYIGYPAEFMRQWSYGCVRVGLFRAFTLKWKARDGLENLKFWQNMCCAIASSSLAVPMQIPFDKVKIRMISDAWVSGSNSKYQGTFTGLHKMLTRPGKFLREARSVFGAAYWRTTVATVSGYASYDTFKTHLQHIFPVAGSLTHTLLASGGSATLTAINMAPFDHLRSRIIAEPKRFAGTFDAFRQVISGEGVLALWRGCGPACAANWLHTFVILNTMEILTKQWDKYFQSQRL